MVSYNACSYTEAFCGDYYLLSIEELSSEQDEFIFLRVG